MVVLFFASPMLALIFISYTAKSRSKSLYMMKTDSQVALRHGKGLPRNTTGHYA